LIYETQCGSSKISAAEKVCLVPRQAMIIVTGTIYQIMQGNRHRLLVQIFGFPRLEVANHNRAAGKTDVNNIEC
jgi:hypothetical protein